MRCYRCYPCNRYFTLDKLLKRKDGKHTDYVCPIYEKVIICNDLQQTKDRIKKILK